MDAYFATITTTNTLNTATNSVDLIFLPFIAVFIILTLFFNAWLKPGPHPPHSRAMRASAKTGNSFEIIGRARITDADGIRVKNREIRLAGLDAPEYGQPAVIRGQTVNHGAIIKNRLIKLIGGKSVRVVVTHPDKYRRLVGTVYLGGTDINAHMVNSGWAVAAYGDQYNQQQEFASRNRIGMWNYDSFHDPRVWKAMDNQPRVPATKRKSFFSKRSRPTSDPIKRYVKRQILPYRYRRLFRL